MAAGSAQAWLTLGVAHWSGEGSSRDPEGRQGVPQGPLRGEGLRWSRAAPTTRPGLSAALRWLPAAVDPETAGPPGRRSGRARGCPLRTRARCSSENRRGQRLSSRPAQGTRSRRLRCPRPRTRAGPRGCGARARGERRPEPGSTKAWEEGLGEGASPARTAALMKRRLGSPRRRGAHLEKANAIGKSRANRQNFY